MMTGDGTGSRGHGGRLLTAGLLAALAGVSIWLWDSLLVKRFVDDPTPFWVGCVVSLALLLVLRALGRWMPGSTRPADVAARLDRGDVALIAAFLVLLCAQNTEHQRASADGRAYFLQVRSMVIDGDVDFTADAKAFGVALAGADEDNPGGVTSYALGTPLAWIPFYGATHAWLGLRNLLGADYDRAGYLNAYQRGVGFGSLIYLFCGLLLLRGLLRRSFDATVVDTGLLLTLFGTFLAWYVAVDPTWSHALSMFSVAAFVVCHETTRDRRLSVSWSAARGASVLAWALLGGVGGFMMMVRWQNVLFFVLPAADLTYMGLRAGRHAGGWAGVFRSAAGIAGGATFAFFPQLLFWRVARAGWLDVPSGEHPIYWNAPYWMDALFSLDRGLFTWTPIAAVAVIGLWFVPRGARRLALLLLLAVALQVYINGTVWWGGHGFGARRFANCGPAFALGLAAAVDQLRRRPRIAVAGALLPLLLLNLFFMREVTRSDLGQRGAVTFDQMVRTVTSRVGHPFALPAAAWLAYRFEADLDFYQRMGGQRYNNVRVDVGAPGDEAFLAGGWAGRETSGGRTFRWSLGRRSYIVFRTVAQAPYVLRFRAAPFRYPDSPEQILTIRVNDAPVWSEALAPDRRDYEVVLPHDAIRVHLNSVSFEYAYATAPRDAGQGDDTRALAVQFERIELIRTR